ncbi:PIN domain nuclease [Mycobacteroides abscessus subsp. abscessus]|uniref:PIN domain nuclease n=1 Tax=Mycobacteroides abscessus TaxID=36809 RepID=UPI0039EF355A
MAVVARYLIDTSAAARMNIPIVAGRLAEIIESGLVATTAVLDAEALYSARSGTEYEQLWRDRQLAYEYLPVNDEHWRTALQAQRRLAQRGQHRAIGIPDLLTAVIAAEHGITVIHYDADFDIAATELDFQHQWVAERGSIP